MLCKDRIALRRRLIWSRSVCVDRAEQMDMGTMTQSVYELG